jgi:hypothetical protein
MIALAIFKTSTSATLDVCVRAPNAYHMNMTCVDAGGYGVQWSAVMVNIPNTDQPFTVKSKHVIHHFILTDCAPCTRARAH